MSDDDSERRILSRKELAREQRRAAYRRAKERWATDPRRLAMKEAAKERRRLAYQEVKARRKAVAADEKARLKGERATARAEKREQVDDELQALVAGTLVMRMVKGSNAQN